MNIIINITKKIGWFLFIFALFLISFTHALLYVLHTRRYRECEVKDEDGTCKDSDYPSNYPTNFFEALGTTYFFMVSDCNIHSTERGWNRVSHSLALDTNNETLGFIDSLADMIQWTRLSTKAQSDSV